LALSTKRPAMPNLTGWFSTIMLAGGAFFGGRVFGSRRRCRSGPFQGTHSHTLSAQATRTAIATARIEERSIQPCRTSDS
jgi:tRNA U34 5-carboxymethylaminomethyl modifying enzyme MnmG/GidA